MKKPVCETIYHCPNCKQSHLPEGFWRELAFCPICGMRCYSDITVDPEVSIEIYHNMKSKWEKNNRKQKYIAKMPESIEVRITEAPILSRNGLGLVSWSPRFLVEMIDTEVEADLIEQGRPTNGALVGNCLWVCLTEEKAVAKAREVSGVDPQLILR